MRCVPSQVDAKQGGTMFVGTIPIEWRSDVNNDQGNKYWNLPHNRKVHLRSLEPSRRDLDKPWRVDVRWTVHFEKAGIRER